MNEEVVLLEEQVAVATADIERLQTRLAEAEARVSGRKADVVELRRQLEALQAVADERELLLATRAAELDAAQTAFESATVQSRVDAARYREILLAHEPDLPGDLVSGDSIPAIDAAATLARPTVAQVRQHLEQQAQALRVPAGSPVRSAPDLSALSASEKIRLGLQQS